MATAPAASLSIDAKAAKILDAAIDVFIERGYAETSMDHVAQTARVSKTTLYTRFPSKEALFAAAVQRKCELTGIFFDPEELIELPLEEALFRIARAMIDIHASPARARAEQILAAESTRFPDLIRIFIDAGPGKVDGALKTYFRQAVERGWIVTDDPDFAAMMFAAASKVGVGLCYECELGLMPMPPEEERDASARKTVRLFLDGLLPRLGA